MACTVLCYVMLTLKAQTDFWCIIVLSVQNISLSDMIFFFLLLTQWALLMIWWILVLYYHI